jgi:hypothetical protein
VICSTGRVGGLIRVEDVLSRCFWSIVSALIALSVLVITVARQCSGHQDLESSRAVRSFDGFF